MAKRALVIEGGGMKAAFANGVLSAFEEADHHPWDAVYGTSAGGALAAWYSAGQARFAEGTWKYARDPRILNYRRALTMRGPLLDHEALLDLVYAREHPLDVAAVQDATWPVVVTVADVESGECHYIDIRHGPVLDWLKATGRLPFAAGPPVQVGGRRYVDGGVVDPIPVRRAVEDGATHVTLVLNKPPGPKRPDPRLVVALASRRYPSLREGLAEHQDRKAAAVAYARHPPRGVRVDLLHPLQETGLHRLSRDQEGLDAAIAHGREVGRGYVGQGGGPRVRWRARA